MLYPDGPASIAVGNDEIIPNLSAPNPAPVSAQLLGKFDELREKVPLVSAETKGPVSAQRMQSLLDNTRKSAGTDSPASQPQTTASSASKIPPQKILQVAEAVDSTKKSIARMISKGRPNELLNADEKAAIAKIEAIKLNPLSLEQLEKTDSSCQGSVPNAYFDPRYHTITVCPGFYGFPLVSIISVLAHEIGHAIDPCGSQAATYKFRRSSAAVFVNKAIRKQATFTPGMATALELILKAPPGINMTSYPFEMGNASPEDLENLEKEGILTKVSAKRSSTENYVLKNAYDCLTGPDGGNFEGFDLAKAADRASAAAKYHQMMVPETNLAAKKLEFLNILAKFPDCDISTRHGKMNEVMADFIAGHVIGEHLEERRAKGETFEKPGDKMAPIAILASVACLRRYGLVHEQNQTDGQKLMGVASDYASARDAHPAEFQRLNYIYLRNPKVRAALGCQMATNCYEREPQ